MRYEIIARNPDFLKVRFYHPRWRAKLIRQTPRGTIDTNVYKPLDHDVTLPDPIEGEDYEEVTIPKQIEQIFRSIREKMEARVKTGR